MKTNNYIIRLLLVTFLAAVHVKAQSLLHPAFSNGSGSLSSGSVGLIFMAGQPVTGQTNGGNFVIKAGNSYVTLPLLTSVENIEKILPDEYSLFQNYPNPFNPSTVIEYNVKERTKVVIRVFNVLGQTVMTPVNNYFDRGKYKLQLDLNGFASGVYVYRVEMGKYTMSKKMILMR